MRKANIKSVNPALHGETEEGGPIEELIFPVETFLISVIFIERKGRTRVGG